jgi:hypothetical protein
MFVDVMVNGVSDTKSQHIDVYPCLFPDTILNDPGIRAALRDAWASSGYPNTPRLEQGGARICNNGACTDYRFPIPTRPLDTSCSLDMTWHVQQYAGIPVAIWHVHPYAFQEWVPCARHPNGGFRNPGGPSVNDWQSSGGLPHIVVDANATYFMPGTTGAPAPLPIPKYDRFGPTGCDILAPPIV